MSNSKEAMHITEPPAVHVQMLIRRPVREVFRAFVDPAVTTRFWFTSSSGRLESGARVVWAWEMYGVSTELRVLELEQDRRIVIEWDDPPTTVEWTFADRRDGTTLVSIANHGFTGSGDDRLRQALDSMGGFSFVLSGLKAWLEHGVALNLVADHHPDANVVSAPPARPA